VRARKDVFVKAGAGMHICEAQGPLYLLPAIPTGQPSSPQPTPKGKTADWYKVGSLLLNEALVLLVRLVPVAVFLLRSKLIRQLLQDHRQQLLPPRLVLRVAGPDGDLYSVPANAVRDPADVVVER
jgi:hypothetical protein